MSIKRDAALDALFAAAQLTVPIFFQVIRNHPDDDRSFGTQKVDVPTAPAASIAKELLGTSLTSAAESARDSLAYPVAAGLVGATQSYREKKQDESTFQGQGTNVEPSANPADNLHTPGNMPEEQPTEQFELYGFSQQQPGVSSTLPSNVLDIEVNLGTLSNGILETENQEYRLSGMIAAPSSSEDNETHTNKAKVLGLIISMNEMSSTSNRFPTPGITELIVTPASDLEINDLKHQRVHPEMIGTAYLPSKGLAQESGRKQLSPKMNVFARRVANVVMGEDYWIKLANYVYPTGKPRHRGVIVRRSTKGKET